MTHVIIADSEAELDALPAEIVWRAKVIVVRNEPPGVCADWRILKHPLRAGVAADLDGVFNYLENL